MVCIHSLVIHSLADGHLIIVTGAAVNAGVSLLLIVSPRLFSTHVRRDFPKHKFDNLISHPQESRHTGMGICLFTIPTHLPVSLWPFPCCAMCPSNTPCPSRLLFLQVFSAHRSTAHLTRSSLNTQLSWHLRVDKPYPLPHCGVCKLWGEKCMVSEVRWKGLEFPPPPLVSWVTLGKFPWKRVLENNFQKKAKSGLSYRHRSELMLKIKFYAQCRNHADVTTGSKENLKKHTTFMDQEYWNEYRHMSEITDILQSFYFRPPQ